MEGLARKQVQRARLNCDVGNAGKSNEVAIPTTYSDMACCRKVVATTDYLLAHQTPGIINSSITSATPQSHSHHFIQPLSWMRPTLSEGQLSGRLDCPNPKCSAQIGRYAWQGMKCSCGVWVCPAFSLGKSKIDEITIRSAPRLVHVT